MRSILSSRTLVLAGLTLTSAVGLGASCESPPADECLVDEQCEGREWRDSSCTPEEAHWECYARQCVGVCPECELATDCEFLSWDGPCDAVDGDWECTAGVCQAVCAGAECTSVAECTGAAWDLPCAGRWVCSSQLCVSLCDHESCGDGLCDAANGEDIESCVPDCSDRCTAPIDCLGETWGEICQGSWSCDFLAGGVCEENCVAPSCGNGQCEPELGEGSHCPDCASLACPSGDGQCDILPIPPGCLGYWTCAWGTCQLVCTTLNVSAIAVPVSGPAPLTVSFGAAGEGGSPPFTFRWDFGQGDTSELQNTSFAYVAPGEYVATVTMSDAAGETTLDSLSVSVTAP